MLNTKCRTNCFWEFPLCKLYRNVGFHAKIMGLTQLQANILLSIYKNQPFSFDDFSKIIELNTDSLGATKYLFGEQYITINDKSQNIIQVTIKGINTCEKINRLYKQNKNIMQGHFTKTQLGELNKSFKILAFTIKNQKV